MAIVLRYTPIALNDSFRTYPFSLQQGIAASVQANLHFRLTAAFVLVSIVWADRREWCRLGLRAKGLGVMHCGALRRSR